MVRGTNFKPGRDGTDRPNDMCTLDSLAFLMIIFLARRSRVGGFEVTGIFRTIVEDATLYFLVIFTSHFVLEMTLTLGRVSATPPLFRSRPKSSNVQCISLGNNPTSSSKVSRHRSTSYITILLCTSLLLPAEMLCESVNMLSCPGDRLVGLGFFPL